MNADTIEEFLKSFKEGFFGLRIGEELYPARLADRVSGRGVIPLQYMVNDKGSFQSHDVTWETQRENIIRGYPDLGYFKVGPTCGYVRTRPYRQYQKGYVPSNVEVFIPNLTQIRMVFPRFIATGNSKELVWQIYNRQLWHPDAALKALADGEGAGYPLSNNFAVYLNSGAEVPILCMKNRDVGVVNSAGKYELFKKFADLKEQFQRETTVEAYVKPS